MRSAVVAENSGISEQVSRPFYKRPRESDTLQKESRQNDPPLSQARRSGRAKDIARRCRHRRSWFDIAFAARGREMRYRRDELADSRSASRSQDPNDRDRPVFGPAAHARAPASGPTQEASVR